ncbi:MAG: peptide deformylase, partial [Myxococcota bacterium]|nr:peptide deformylase [Myxococcota bacterium]
MAEPVAEDQAQSSEIRQLIADMHETLVEYEGAGLAAPQVHVSRRIVLVSLQEDEPTQVWINPEITPLTEESIASFEGCLSVPGLRALVPRCAEIDVHATSPEGRPIHLRLSGFPATVAQHECD